MPHPLRTRAFRLLFIGRTLSLVGDAVIPTALSLAVYLATGSTGALALVLGCAMVPKLLLLPLGGVVGDRFNARTVALTTDLVRCATQLFVGAELLGGSPALWQIALAEAVGGAAGAFAMPTASPLIRGTVAESGLLRANSLMAVVNSATRLGGPALAGLLILTAGPGWAFVLDGATFAVSAALLSAVEVRHVPIPRRSLLTDLKEGWGEVRSRDWYWTSLIGHATWNGAAAVLMTVGPALFLRELGGKGVWVALLQTGAVGLLLGSLLAGRARPRRPVLVANLGLATYALPLGLLAAHAPVALTIAAYGVAQAGLGFLGPVWDSSVQSAVPAHALARVTSYDWLLSLGAMPLGYALAPLAASAWGAEVPLAIAAATVGAACLGTAAVPGVRRFGAPDKQPERAAELPA
ncbi:MFS transporter [Streptomyces sp. NBC_01005]|uniref:MFS transporter n=1 Tax=unclassified Streptomyces TaxID=2593676 RepID=UPI002254602A|nr:MULTISPECIES: MFS transporter [unclassified Streptomyces]WSW05853.1 MFS transporter [Streptomyces sp. NBC_01005]WTB56306.1 MFS transporter [Streptomyces sp. NBC_00826]WTC95357.1 MFS transporter [Streptomyces sp. NBC_01650]WTH90810.1 MFS transporter [Streptomyces sp. NBC_00825]WTH99536.1 MFS transporter [Streptomyces sp. NBC_00822]